MEIKCQINCLPVALGGCGREIRHIEELYRCGDCDAFMHRHCLRSHYSAERLALDAQLTAAHEKANNASEHAAEVAGLRAKLDLAMQCVNHYADRDNWLTEDIYCVADAGCDLARRIKAEIDAQEAEAAEQTAPRAPVRDDAVEGEGR